MIELLLLSYVHHEIEICNDLESTDDIVYGTERLNLIWP
jgi:hypothetical protein